MIECCSLFVVFMAVCGHCLFYIGGRGKGRERERERREQVKMYLFACSYQVLYQQDPTNSSTCV